jgi:hypothetical protein
MIWRYSNIFLRIASVIISATLLSADFAEAVEAPKEEVKVSAYSGIDLKEYGTDINADISHLGLLFGAASDRESRPTNNGETAEKGW